MKKEESTIAYRLRELADTLESTEKNLEPIMVKVTEVVTQIKGIVRDKPSMFDGEFITIEYKNVELMNERRKEGHEVRFSELFGHEKPENI